MIIPNFQLSNCYTYVTVRSTVKLPLSFLHHFIRYTIIKLIRFISLFFNKSAHRLVYKLSALAIWAKQRMLLIRHTNPLKLNCQPKCKYTIYATIHRQFWNICPCHTNSEVIFLTYAHIQTHWLLRHKATQILSA